MLFHSYFKTLVGKEVTVDLKNGLAITGTLHSVDQYLNIKLLNIHVSDEEKYPHLASVRNCFIRGSVVRYIEVCERGREGERRRAVVGEEGRAEAESEVGSPRFGRGSTLRLVGDDARVDPLLSVCGRWR